ncbi:hypothetical protein ATY41_05685 [Leifsonia xyli subsp. xyli]|uniref:DUF2231 domain-containing protein n=2 Tax=Leifsonia xyli subsp. xyli TaxID=59736 RepID=Q6AES7_LEIXX|nr:DUF2231 domain-containing protein [Leifsonia xyli]AAT89118.1 conserved hypothetical protein [Leifsonia xyli subsp. xyli str. CTCB07]ODA89404.1 hypothetical protein ATY41_05685 [Leifsonia xyli subsp. xyli]
MEINGLPLHPLLVHFVVVLVPLAAICTVLVPIWPAARRRLGIVTPLLALLNMVLVPIVTDAGEWLQKRVPSTPLIEQHAALGRMLYPCVIAVFVFAAVQWSWFSFFDREGSPRRPPVAVRRAATVVLAAIALGLAIGSTVEMILIGEAGSRAIWENSFSPTPLPATPTP